MIEIKHLNKTYHTKNGTVVALNDVSLTIEDGTVYGVIGYSGAGKSTLVRCLNLLELPDSGSLSIGDSKEMTFSDKGVSVGGKVMHQRDCNHLRRGIGMIFQHFNLLDRSTVFENIAYPLRFGNLKKDAITARVKELLDLVGLSDKIDAYPSELSGGQKQRVAIARALANNPAVLLSDEATSALDPDATESILNLLRDLNHRLGITIVIITHEMAVIKSICHRVAVMENGCVVEEGTVYDIFSHPKQAITRRFASSSTPLGRIDRMIEENSDLIRLKDGEILVKLMFQPDCVGEHVITTAAKKYGFDLNVVLANVEYLEDKPLGGMIGTLSGPKESIEKAIAWLKENHVETEVIRNGMD